MKNECIQGCYNVIFSVLLTLFNNVHPFIIYNCVIAINNHWVMKKGQ